VTDSRDRYPRRLDFAPRRPSPVEGAAAAIRLRTLLSVHRKGEEDGCLLIDALFWRVERLSPVSRSPALQA